MPVRLSLSDNLRQVTMRITKALDLYQDAQLSKETAGLMGANVLYLAPGNKDKPVLSPGMDKERSIQNRDDAILDEIELIVKTSRASPKK